MTDTAAWPNTESREEISRNTKKQHLANKKIYFDADGTEIKIGYDDQTGVGFVEIIAE